MDNKLQRVALGLLVLLPAAICFYQEPWFINRKATLYQPCRNVWNGKLCNLRHVRRNQPLAVISRPTMSTARREKTNSDQDNENEMSLLPESSFGSEVVPEGQRPVNEYINLMKQPLFDWASEKSGTNGLLIRLAILYLISFVAMYVGVCDPFTLILPRNY